MTEQGRGIGSIVHARGENGYVPPVWLVYITVEDFNAGLERVRALGGVCHARGENAYVPPVWLVYITVEDLDASIERAQALGGVTIGPVREAESMGRYQVIRDPAGAVCALWQAS